MNELTDFCNGSRSALEGMDIDQLREACLNFGAALEPSEAGVVVVIAFGLVAALLVLIHRVMAAEDALPAVGTTIEGAVYGALAAYTGLVAGLVLAEFVLPVIVGLLFAILAAVGLLLAVVATVRGDGDVGWKVFGFIQSLVLVGALGVLAAMAFAVPTSGPAADEYATYLNTVSFGLAAAAGINAILVAIFRGVHWAAGWLLVPLNSSWGFIGNLLGLMTHIASFNGYADHGAHHKASDRRYYVCYEKGLSLKQNAAGRFAFSQGAVMSADREVLRRHEGVHVWQHYLGGPLYPLSHFAWFIGMIPFGLIGAAVKSVGVAEGVTAWSYYNNPWEVMAYGFINPTGRNPAQTLIWEWWLGILCAVLWISGAIAAFVVFVLAVFGEL